MRSGRQSSGAPPPASSPEPREAFLAPSLRERSLESTGVGADARSISSGGRFITERHRPLWASAFALATGLAHVSLIAPHYFVGSFDDDSSYILAARALLHGQGLTGHMTGGAVVAGVYPPGYSALIAPLVWLWPHSFLPVRVLSVACYAAVFPLTWVYLRRRGVGAWVVAAALWVLALGPPFATFGSMVMAETPFLVALLVLLLLVDRWDRQERALTATAVAVVVCAGALVWLKEAALGMVAGLALWELIAVRGSPRWSSRIGRSALVVFGTGALLVPVLVARISAGVPLAGSRYSQELGGYYAGGIGSRVLHVVPHGLWQMVSTAIGTTLVPYLSPLPTSGHLPDLWKVVSWHVSILAGVGAVVWFRRHRDAAIAIIPTYLAETLLWPFVNERRVILALPLIASWYVIGGFAVWQAFSSRLAARRPGRLIAARRLAVSAAALVVVIPLLFQLPRDYLYNTGQAGSHFAGSRYATVLASIGPKEVPVETDYLYSAALFTGHRTVRTAFDVTLTACYLPGVLAAFSSDSAGFLLLGDLNKPGVMDSPCLLRLADSQPWAVRLLHTTRDDASAYELIGPGTAHPDLKDLVASARFSEVSSPGRVVYEWDWSSPAKITQASVGEAAFSGSGERDKGAELEIEVSPGVWRGVASATSGVGDRTGSAPFLLADLAAGVEASGIRVVVRGQGSSVSVADVHALGLAR
jgi:hypothetical protein